MSQTPGMVRAAVILIFLVLLLALPSVALPFIFMATIGGGLCLQHGNCVHLRTTGVIHNQLMRCCVAAWRDDGLLHFPHPQFPG